MTAGDDKPDRRNVEAPGRTKEEKAGGGQDPVKPAERPPPGSKPTLVPKKEK